MSLVRRYDFSGLTAMVVDDSDFFTEVFSDILSAFGITEIKNTRSAKEAIERIEDIRPNIVFLDWEMENDSCKDFMKAIRHNAEHAYRTVPVVLITGYTEIQRIHAARDMGINEFIVKPISAKILHARLVKLVENPRSFYQSETYFGPDRRRKQVEIDFECRRITENSEVEV